MEINSAMDAGLQGIQKAQQKLDHTADQIAKNVAVEPQAVQQEEARIPADMAEKLVELREQELAFEASAEVIRTADKVLSKFIDQMV